MGSCIRTICFNAFWYVSSWVRFASVICGLPVVVVVSLDYDIPDEVYMTC